MAINPFKEKPLYEENQVVTLADLIGLHVDLDLALRRTRWYEVAVRYQLRLTINIITLLINWLEDGKPLAQRMK